MSGMVIDYWTRFGATPLWLSINFLVFLAFILYLVVDVIHHFSVEGSHRSYVSSTIIKTLCLPLFGAFVFEVAMDLFTAHWFSALLDSYLAYVRLRDWNRIKDNDDWWTGRGRRLKKKLRSMFTSSSPAKAGAAG